MDNRRRQYVPLYVYYASGKTGTRIKREFGAEGLCAWVGFLTACKRNPIQGQLEYASEGEAWGKLGMGDIQPDWPIDRLWTLTGRLHKTSRRTSGELTTIVCRVWSDWEQNIDRETAAQRSRRKRAPNTRDNPRTKRERYPDEDSTEGEGEEELQLKASPSPSVLSAAPLRSARKARSAPPRNPDIRGATGWRKTPNHHAEHWVLDPDGTDTPSRNFLASWQEAEDRRQASERERATTEISEDELPPVDPEAASKIREMLAQTMSNGSEEDEPDLADRERRQAASKAQLARLKAEK